MQTLQFVSVPPQPSPTEPQGLPSWAQVAGVQTGVPTHEVRSNSMNSRSFSCGVMTPLFQRGEPVHSAGKACLALQPFWQSSTWKSLKTMRPHVPSAPPAVNGVSNVKCTGMAGFVESIQSSDGATTLAKSLRTTSTGIEHAGRVPGLHVAPS